MGKNESTSENQEEIHPIETQISPSKVEIEPKMSLIERTLYNYGKKFFSQGYKRLTEKQYVFYFYWTVIIMVGSIITSVLFSLDYIPNEEIAKTIIFLSVFTAGALILGGFIGGLTQNRRFLNIFTVSLMFLALCFSILYTGILPGIYIPKYDSLILQWVKMLYFLSYVVISSISMFAIIWNFQTSFSYRFISYGKSHNRLLFQGVLRLGALIAIPMYAYMFIQGTLDAEILAGIGIIITSILLIRFYRLPKFYRKESFEEKNEKIALMNFNQILGFYNLYLVYRLSQSFNTGGNISNLTVDLLLLAVNSFFVMNTLSKKIDNIEDEDDIQKNFVFQRDTGFMVWLKKKVSEKGLVLIILGIALGYHAVYMDSYLDSPIVLIQILSDPNNITPLNVTYNRTFLGIALFWILVNIITFKVNPRFRRLAINRYSARHILRMFGDLFRISDDGKAGAVLEAYENGLKKVEDGVSEIGKKIKGKWDKMFSLGNNSDSPDKSP
ncbi:MAG: hypothetical protein ACTSYI_12345 [Promethearchaeota archaeon]